jgi:putative ABC transport system ATP-binding protein
MKGGGVMTMRPILSVRDISMIYGSGETAVRALDGASLDVRPGELLLVEGPSGSGKTTLVSILGLLLRPTSGQIRVGERDVTALPDAELADVRATTFGFVFQGFNLFPALTALDNVALGIRVKDRQGKKDRRERHDVEARRLLAAVGLESRANHLPANLSGGQKQRVAIARALGGDPQVVVGDEPTAALDTKTALGVMDLLRELVKERGKSVVVVTHDPRLERYADRVVRVEDGIVDGGPRESGRAA